MKSVVHEVSGCSLRADLLRSNKFDCVLINSKLPGANDAAVLGSLTKMDCYIVTMILLADMGGEQLVTKVIQKMTSTSQ